ncbi:MAG: glycosyl hydrolase 115 family protein, partial [Tannerella sp.]|nr:glycosyl hydrolase 115 family protein [Tannerella sp.]
MNQKDSHLSLKKLCLLCILFAGTICAKAQVTIDGDTPWIVADGQQEAVARALEDVQTDWYKVFGRNPIILREAPEAYRGLVIYIGEKGAWRERLVKEPFAGAESYILELTSDETGRPALVATGADKRGCIYAAYTLSEELLGIDPWYFFTDNVPEMKTSIPVSAGFKIRSGVPTFKYRGWFMNDEDLTNSFAPDPLRENVFSLSHFEKIYETILRLKGNMVAPATFPFPDEKCQELAARRGLVINMHHILVLGLNTYRWPKDVPFSYSRDPGIMERYWQQCIDAFKDYEVVWTVGYRGKHDKPFWNDEPEIKTPEQRGEIISRAIAKQVEMVRRKRPNDDFIANMWMEGAILYHQGHLKIPEGVTLVWADNGAGFIADKPGLTPWDNTTASDDKATVKAGQGIYYHTAMMNGRANQLTEMVPPSRLSHEILRFTKAGATMYFLDNVSDIRPCPLTTDAAMKIVWDASKYIDKSDDENHRTLIREWSERQFGAKVADKVAAVYESYFNIPYVKEQASDHLLANKLGAAQNTVRGAIKEGKKLDEKQLTAVKENLRFATDNLPYVRRLTSQAVSLASQIPPARKDFYQAHVLTALYIHLYLLEALENYSRSSLAYNEGNKPSALKYAVKVTETCDRMLRERRKAEYGRWQGWYKGEQFVNLQSCYQIARTLNALLNGEPEPLQRRFRGING